ncbi:MAG TPA: carboxypeptidase-like regulatory domain-containing protein, partial [Blastocatellia bacterium]|nr:carboxypeptidase-like regulatory domain-containing protein [Blastocatellia bacterium]
MEGTVTDSAGAVIPGAQIKLRDAATNQTRAVQTDERGFFRANELPVGPYEVRVEQSGFAPYLHAGIMLAIGQTARLDIVLVPAGSATQITVTDQPPAIDRSQTSVTTTIDTERIEELPVRSRNYLNFVLLAPGVAASNRQQTGTAQTQLADSGFTFGGLRARSNNLSIDGLDNND